MMTPTPQQQRAIHTIDRSLGIVAGAGSGKTGVLIERCRYLLEHAHVPLAHLLALTFTERAAAEMVERLRAALPPELADQLPHAQISTFHGFCHRVLREHAVRARLAPGFGLLSAPEAEAMLQQSIHHTLLQDTRDAHPATCSVLSHFRFDRVVERLHTVLAQRAQLYAQVIALPFVPPPPPLPARTAAEQQLHDHLMELAWRALEVYRATKQQMQVVDFDDLEWHTLHLFRDEPGLLAEYQRQFHHLLIDECQDTNPIQLAILDCLYTPPDNILCIVGDPKQSIYRFRGAVVECFHYLLAQIERTDGEILYLQENFRSHPAIIALANRAIPDIPAAEQLLPMRTDVPGNGIAWLQLPEIETARQYRAAEAEAMACTIRTLHQSGVPFGDIVCLAATRTAFPLYARIFREQGIAVQSESGQLFARPIVRDLLCLLQVLVGLQHENPNDGALLRVLRSPLFGWSADDCYRAVQMQDYPLPPHQPRLHAALANFPDIRDRLQRWSRTALQMSPPESLYQICDENGLPAVLAALDPSGALQNDYDQFILYAHTLGHLALPEFVRTAFQYVQAESGPSPGEGTALSNDAVRLLTIHATKGNQFPIVLLADLAAKPQPRLDPWHLDYTTGLVLSDLGPTQANDDPSAHVTSAKEWLQQSDQSERDRLLYVATTRAQNLLILPMPMDIPSRLKSPWLVRLHGLCTELSITPTREAALSLVQRVAPEQRPPWAPAARLPATSHHDEAHRAMPIHGDVVVTGPAKCQSPANACVHYTVSELETFARCPEEYRLKYRLRLPTSAPTWQPEREFSEALRGTVVHAALRAMQESGATIDHAIAAALRQYGVPGTPEIVHTIRPYLHYARQWHTETKTTNAHVELPFHLRQSATHGPALISGTIDLLRQSAKGWEIIDYKTDRVRMSADLELLQQKYALQMALYALAAHTAGFTPMVATHLLCLDAQKALTTCMTAESLHATHVELATLLDRLATHDYTISAGHTPPCTRCPYAQMEVCQLRRDR